MKGHSTTLLSVVGGLTLLAGKAAAHPGHGPTDVTAQLSAPLAGPDHILVFATVSVLAALAAARVVLAIVERAKRQNSMARTRRR